MLLPPLSDAGAANPFGLRLPYPCIVLTTGVPSGNTNGGSNAERDNISSVNSEILCVCVCVGGGDGVVLGCASSTALCL